MARTFELQSLPDARRFPVVVLATWGIVALVAAAQTAMLVGLSGGAGLGHALAVRLAIIPLWAAATPAILRSSRRFPIGGLADGAIVRSRVARNLAVHLLLGSAFVALSNLVIRVPQFVGAGGAGALALARATLLGVTEYYPAAIIVYLVIVAVGHQLSRAGSEPTATRQMESLHIESAADTPTAPVAPIEQLGTSGPPEVSCLTVRQWNRTHLVRLDEIDWVQAEDNYVVVHAAGRRFKGRERIGDVEARLDARRFVRIHRSTIVHVTRIREVQPLTHGDHAVVLRDGTVLRVARSRREALTEVLGL